MYRGPFPVVGNAQGVSLPLKESFRLTDRLLEDAGLEDYVGCTTMELINERGSYLRPAPNMFKTERYARLIQLFEKYGNQLYDQLFRLVKPGVQTYDARTKIGGPLYIRRADKLGAILPWFETVLSDHQSFFSRDDVFTVTNIRLQPERLGKERKFPFVMDDGRVLEKVIDREARFNSKFGRYASRTRMVYNYAVSNLLTQVLDTMLHDVWLGGRFAHHQMPRLVGERLPGHTLFLDCKHFERSIGAAVGIRASLIGGKYADITHGMLEQPVLCRSYTGSPMFVKPSRGSVMQLGSGLSAVAPIAKDVLALIYISYLVEEYNLSFVDAFQSVYSGGTMSRFCVMNYGDDNVLYGEDKHVLSNLLEYMNEFLDVEEEDPPKFLGYMYGPKGFHLGIASYVLNFVLAERAPGSLFRPYAFYGYVERDKVYNEQGDEHVHAYMRKMAHALAAYGYTPAVILKQALKEREDMKLAGIEFNEKIILGKEYQLTDEEKLQLIPEIQGLSPSETLLFAKLLTPRLEDR